MMISNRLERGDHLWERGVCSVVGFSFQTAGWERDRRLVGDKPVRRLVNT
jgi:hypothetical protein